MNPGLERYYGDRFCRGDTFRSCLLFSFCMFQDNPKIARFTFLAVYQLKGSGHYQGRSDRTEDEGSPVQVVLGPTNRNDQDALCSA